MSDYFDPDRYTGSWFNDDPSETEDCIDEDNEYLYTLSDYEDEYFDEDYVEYEGVNDEFRDEYYTHGVYKPSLMQRIRTLYNRFRYWVKYRNDDIPF